jgi:phosphatidate cytidylyltransferase
VTHPEATVPAAPPAVWLSPMGKLGLVVLGLLIVATAIVRWLRASGVKGKLDEVEVKIRSWWYMAPIFYFGVVIGGWVPHAMIALICYISLKEYYTLIPTTQSDRGALMWSYLIIPIHSYWIWTSWFEMFAIFIPVYLFLFIPVRQVLAGRTEDFVARTGRILWGALLFVYCLSHMGYFLTLGPTKGDPGITGREMLLYLVFLTELNDVCAFCTGKLFGKTKIAPEVSPNKTWEGAIGGVCCTMLLATLLRFLTPFSVLQAMLVGFGLGVAGLFGDLCVSAVKRDVGVKDSGDFIPGHGGILDRVDSLTYTAPLFLHYVRYYCY